VVVLEVRGRRSGKPRRTVVARTGYHRERYLEAASGLPTTCLNAATRLLHPTRLGILNRVPHGPVPCVVRLKPGRPMLVLYEYSNPRDRGLMVGSAAAEGGLLEGFVRSETHSCHNP
jgi:hypothetical protein